MLQITSTPTQSALDCLLKCSVQLICDLSTAVSLFLSPVRTFLKLSILCLFSAMCFFFGFFMEWSATLISPNVSMTAARWGTASRTHSSSLSLSVFSFSHLRTVRNERDRIRAHCHFWAIKSAVTQ